MSQLSMKMSNIQLKKSLSSVQHIICRKAQHDAHIIQQIHVFLNQTI